MTEGNGTIIGKEINEDIETFDGSENTISISRVYSIQFFCEYDMAWYPFDVQTCTIEMVMDGVLENYADLLPGDLHFSGPKELTQYFVPRALPLLGQTAPLVARQICSEASYCTA